MREVVESTGNLPRERASGAPREARHIAQARPRKNGTMVGSLRPTLGSLWPPKGESVILMTWVSLASCAGVFAISHQWASAPGVMVSKKRRGAGVLVEEDEAAQQERMMGEAYIRGNALRNFVRHRKPEVFGWANRTFGGSVEHMGDIRPSYDEVIKSSSDKVKNKEFSHA